MVTPTTDLQALLGEATDGPWLLCAHLKDGDECSCGYRGGIFGGDQEGIICEIGNVPTPGEEGLEAPRYERPTELANARLIAMAPDLAREVVRMREATWQPIETAPKGVPRVKGASGVYWMTLAWPDDEGGVSTGSGMRVNDKFYSSGVFYCGGPLDGKQYHFKEIEVFPTHWMPLPTPPEEGE